MQDEIIKHGVKALKIAKNKDHSFTEKVKEITLEILIIVFAVSLSIWLHNMSEHSHRKGEVQQFYADIYEDLNTDILRMEEAKKMLLKSKTHYDKIKSVTKKNIQDFKIHDFDFDFIVRKTNMGNYVGFISSGKIGNIEDKELKKKLLDYYQEDMLSLEDFEKKYNDRTFTLLEDLGSLRKKEEILNLALRTRISLNEQVANSLIKAYTENIKLAEELKKLTKSN